MVVGLGVDIVEIARIERAFERHPRIGERLFSDAERTYCDARSRPAVHYALRFAAKEAVLKSLGTGFSGIRFTDVEVTHDEKGRPVPILHGRAAKIAEGLGVSELHVSLSFTQTTAVASAVALTREAMPTPPEPTPTERLAAAFKDARGMLDELGTESSPPSDDEGPGGE